jgi:hypothetical protein
MPVNRSPGLNSTDRSQACRAPICRVSSVRTDAWIVAFDALIALPADTARQLVHGKAARIGHAWLATLPT